MTPSAETKAVTISCRMTVPFDRIEADPLVDGRSAKAKVVDDRC
jgi:hypothetical protein